MKLKKITGFLVMAIMFTLILSMTIFTASADTDLSKASEGIVKKDDGTAANWVEIDFLNDTVKAGFDVGYYTVDGTKWIALSIEKTATEGVNIAKIIDKGGKLKFTSALDPKTGAPQKEVLADAAKEIDAVPAAITVDFGTIDARPAPPKFKPNYNAKNSGEDGYWTLGDGKTTVLKEADWAKYVIVESDKSGKAPLETTQADLNISYEADYNVFTVTTGVVQWQEFEPIPVKPLGSNAKSVKTTYMVKSVLIATDTKITPPSKAAKVTVSGYGKPAKVKVDYKKEIVTLKGDMIYNIGAAFVDKGVTKDAAKLGVKFANIFKDLEITNEEGEVIDTLEYADAKYVYGTVWVAGTDKKPPTAEYELIVNGPSELAVNTTLAKFTEDAEALAGGLNEAKHTYKLPKGYEVYSGGKWVTSVKTPGTYDVRIKSTAKFNEKSIDWEAYNKIDATTQRVTGATAENCMMSGKTASNALKLKVGKGKYEDSKGNKKDGIIFITLLDPREAEAADEEAGTPAVAAPEYLIAGGSDVSAATSDKLDIGAAKAPEVSSTVFTIKLTGATFVTDENGDVDATKFTVAQTGGTPAIDAVVIDEEDASKATITLTAAPNKGKIIVTIAAAAVEQNTASGFKPVAATGLKVEVEVLETLLTTPSAAVVDAVVISGLVDEALTGTNNIKIKLTNETFAASVIVNANVTGWITNIGTMTAKITAINSAKDEVTIKIEGTPDDASTDALTIAIPAASLTTTSTGTLSVTNTGGKAKFNIVEPIVLDDEINLVANTITLDSGITALTTFTIGGQAFTVTTDYTIDAGVIEFTATGLAKLAGLTPAGAKAVAITASSGEKYTGTITVGATVTVTYGTNTSTTVTAGRIVTTETWQSADKFIVVYSGTGSPLYTGAVNTTTATRIDFVPLGDSPATSTFANPNTLKVYQVTANSIAKTSADLTVPAT